GQRFVRDVHFRKRAGVDHVSPSSLRRRHFSSRTRCAIYCRGMRVWLPLPDSDFDVTEVAVPWRLLTDSGYEVCFATERGGGAPSADGRLLTGVLFGQLGAEAEPKQFYAEMIESPEYRSPAAWSELDLAHFDGLILPGGHAPGMRQYLGSTDL